ncbi:hypothetical protein HK104_007329 [Borealophlyctis nickersoniae]|nr:hypothetical protein HK104_007329 [Borealophlyctis nickersoniae]
MAPSALVLIADGSEEMEAGAQPVKCSRNVKIVPDAALNDVKGNPFDALVLPGGMGGAKAFSESSIVQGLLQQYHNDPKKTVAIICASPIALKAAGVAKGKAITSHPSVKDQLDGEYTFKEDRVVEDGNLLTSRGPGTAFEFALALVKRLKGQETVQEVVPPMLIHPAVQV